MNKSLLKQRQRTLGKIRTAKGLQSRANELGVKLPQYKAFKDDERLIKYREFLLREYSIKLNELESEFSNTRMISKSKLTYQETAQILGESIQNVKNLIHRGKKELRKILIRKGFDEMNKVSKVIIIMFNVWLIFV